MCYIASGLRVRGLLPGRSTTVKSPPTDVKRSTPTQQPTIPWSSLLRQRPRQCSTLQLTQPSSILQVSGFVASFLDEVLPTVMQAPGVDLGHYRNKLLDRFSNPHIDDTLLRLAEDGSQKLQTTMRPVLLDQLESGAEFKVKFIYLCIYIYMYMYIYIYVYMYIYI